MEEIPQPVIFEWDVGNREKNLVKHGVQLIEIEEAFCNILAVLPSDDKHSVYEKRNLLLGVTDLNRKLSITFTFRADKIRVVSARDMSKKERTIYEKTKNHTKI